MQVDFLYDLMRLDEVATSDSDSPSKPTHELPERRAARSLFRWEVRPSPCVAICILAAAELIALHIARRSLKGPALGLAVHSARLCLHASSTGREEEQCMCRILCWWLVRLEG